MGLVVGRLIEMLLHALVVLFLFLLSLPKIERQLFEETVKTLNNFYAEAEKIGGSSYLEGCLACATAYFIFLCMETRYEKVWGHNRAGRTMAIVISYSWAQYGASKPDELMSN